MADILNVVLPVFILIGFGYVARWRGFVADVHIDALMKFALNFAVPALLFGAISTLDLQADLAPSMLLSFYTGAFTCFFLGLFGAHYVFKRAWEDSVAIGFCCLFSNSLLLGVPIAERAYGPDSLGGAFAIISVHSLFCYGLGISTMEIVRARGKSIAQTVQTVAKGMFRNVLVMAIFAGFAVNLFGITLPASLTDSLGLLSQTALPVALFGIGGVLKRYKPEGDLRIVLYICVISLVVHPAITFGMGMQFNLSQEYLRSAVIISAMAPGINSYIFASLYGHAMRVAASGVLVATSLSILSVSAWLIVLG